MVGEIRPYRMRTTGHIVEVPEKALVCAQDLIALIGTDYQKAMQNAGGSLHVMRIVQALGTIDAQQTPQTTIDVLTDRLVLHVAAVYTERKTNRLDVYDEATRTTIKEKPDCTARRILIDVSNAMTSTEPYLDDLTWVPRRYQPPNAVFI